jgi:Protein of unknown function (DUF3352)
MDQRQGIGQDLGQSPEPSRPQSQSEGSVISAGEGWASGVHPHQVGSPSRRFRWTVAGAVVLCLALVTAAGAYVLSGASGTKSLTASMAPKNSVVFVELRTDLPGDQHQKLADFMSHFPGFADRAQFDNALDELLNRITGSVSPDLAYTSAFKPWMEGEVSLAVTSLGVSGPTALEPTPNPALGPSGLSVSPLRYSDAVVIVALKDRAKAEAWVGGELSSVGVAVKSATYAGATLEEIQGPGGVDEGAYAFTSQDLLLGTTAAVKAALDTTANGSLADSANYQAAMNSVAGDSLARFYLDSRALGSSFLDMYDRMTNLFSGMVPSPAPSFDLGNVPAWVAGSVRAESNDVLIQMTVPQSIAKADNHVSALAPALPASTVFTFEAHSVGKAVTDGLDRLRSQASLLGIDQSQLDQLQSALGLIGGLGWIGDAAVAVTLDGSDAGGGVLISTPDASTAQAKLDTLTNLIALSSGATGIASRTETYNGHTITILSTSVGDAASKVEIGVTTKNDLIVVGYSDTFAKAVLDTTSSNSLASQPDYSAVMNAVGNSNTTSFYLNVPALEAKVGQMASSPSSWNLNYKPYFDHVGGIGYATVGGATSTVRIVFTAR